MKPWGDEKTSTAKTSQKYYVLASRVLFMIRNLLQILVKKDDLFNYFFVKQCSVTENNSVLPSSTNPILICKLDLNKAYGHDMISICMLKMSGNAIIESLFTIFKICLK